MCSTMDSALPANGTDLDAERVAHPGWEATEAAGRDLHTQILGTARLGVTAVLTLDSKNREEVATALHCLGGEMDDVTFALIVEGLTGVS
jgi:hypothetical protein